VVLGRPEGRWGIFQLDHFKMLLTPAGFSKLPTLAQREFYEKLICGDYKTKPLMKLDN
jgi:hypothetical protein